MQLWADPLSVLLIVCRTLFIGGIDWSVSEDLVRNKLREYGDIMTVTLLPDRKCGFVTFGTREDVEKAMTTLFDLFYLNKRKCELNWAKSKGDKGSGTAPTHKTQHGVHGMHGNVESAVAAAVAIGPQIPSGQSGNVVEAPQGDTTTSSNVVREVVAAPITADEQEFLRSQGIVPPKLPPMPDPIACGNTGYAGRTSTAYKSMTAHYKEAKIQ